MSIVYVTTFEPAGEQGGVGGSNWSPSRDRMEALFYERAADPYWDDSNLYLFRAEAPDGLTREEMTDWVDDLYSGSDQSAEAYAIRMGTP
jgi:hypothetical protein